MIWFDRKNRIMFTSGGDECEKVIGKVWEEDAAGTGFVRERVALPGGTRRGSRRTRPPIVGSVRAEMADARGSQRPSQWTGEPVVGFVRARTATSEDFGRMDSTESGSVRARRADSRSGSGRGRLPEVGFVREQP